MQTDSNDLKDTKLSNSGNLYPVMELETVYSNLLNSDKSHHNNHSTTFTDLCTSKKCT